MLKIMYALMTYYNNNNEYKTLCKMFVNPIEGFNETYFLNTLPEEIRTDIKLIESINIKENEG